MRTRSVLAACLVSSLLIGCAKVTDHMTKGAATLESDPEFKAPVAESTTSNSEASNRELAEFDFSPQRVEELTKQVEQNPKDPNLLMQLARAKHVRARYDEDSYPGFAKAGEYVHRALEIDPDFVKSDRIRLVAGEILYDEACALARENQKERSLESLKQSVDLNERLLTHYLTDNDLDNLRNSKEFAAFEEFALEKRRDKARESVDKMLAAKPQFKFDFDLKDTEGNPVSKKDYAGKILLVNVWGTWCPPCRAELPDLIAAREKYKSQGFDIIGINSESESGEDADRLIKELQKKAGITYRCALGDDKTFSQIPNLSGIPTSLFLNRSGEIQAMTVGMIDSTRLELIIERLLKDSPEEGKPEEAKPVDSDK